jgi:hypothetical protein
LIFLRTLDAMHRRSGESQLSFFVPDAIFMLSN